MIQVLNCSTQEMKELSPSNQDELKATDEKIQSIAHKHKVPLSSLGKPEQAWENLEQALDQRFEFLSLFKEKPIALKGDDHALVINESGKKALEELESDLLFIKSLKEKALFAKDSSILNG